MTYAFPSHYDYATRVELAEEPVVNRSQLLSVSTASGSAVAEERPGGVALHATVGTHPAELDATIEGDDMPGLEQE